MSEHRSHGTEHEPTSWLLDREAGSWRPEGMDETLRDAISQREHLIDELVAVNNTDYTDPDNINLRLVQRYKRARARVADLKDRSCVGDPPPLSPEDE